MNVTGQDVDAYALRGDSEADTVTKGLGKLKTSSIEGPNVLIAKRDSGTVTDFKPLQLMHDNELISL